MRINKQTKNGNDTTHAFALALIQRIHAASRQIFACAANKARRGSYRNDDDLGKGK